MEVLIRVLEKTVSNLQTDQNEAASLIKDYIRRDFTGFLKALSDVLFEQQNPSVVRAAAGLELKNQLTARDELSRQKQQERWLNLPEETRRYIKERVFGTLGTETYRLSSAPRCVAYIAIFELPERLWPSLIRDLTHIITNHDSTEQLRLASMEAIDYIFQEIDQSSLESSDYQSILKAIVSHGVQDPTVSNEIKLAGTSALSNFPESEVQKISKLLKRKSSKAQKFAAPDRYEQRTTGRFNRETYKPETTPIIKYGFIALSILGLAWIIMLKIENTGTRKNSNEKDEIEINFEQIDALNRQYPGLFTPKELRMIRRRLEVMRNQVSILMLLGKSRDSHCKLDPTFCVARTIANATQIQPGYIDASDPHLQSKEIEKELRDSLNGNKYSIMIDSIESLHGSQVLNLFNFIDKDEFSKRRGMLLFVVYTGFEFDYHQSKLKEADIAEKVLVDKWLPFVQKDTLFSVISRMCGSIVKIH